MRTCRTVELRKSRWTVIEAELFAMSHGVSRELPLGKLSVV